ncbi:3,4-dihydroxy-2-butanone-4-phosphate synthase [Sandaracinus amylolyticus]|uniref:3,4-dihydroxy-2-butanone-4-phosphate synthase n=1 Tax=Sandaracinus amylolyticus TaxID=927083 RepID=UPI001F0138C6|nr:3,4-dihydroxy-2-butanone-4-phosphate synthase [Sandaracinus amylolyticus]UJR80478.1 Riboflavin biosynthesis protein RibBA [Sandaracinus amylolyticus]
MLRTAIERVHRALEDIRAGRMVILVDDEDRENEGDLVMAAEKVTPEAINFMAKWGRGLICLTITDEHVQQLDLPMMVDDNQSQRSTAFTISIEARHGVSTGISAADRAHTIKVAIAEDARPSDIVSPGHVFPLKARPGGVLQRTGHTEGSVDLAHLAGFRPAGVICEIMNDDGTMARMPDLVEFAEKHGLRILSIADLIQYRLEHEQMIERRLDGEIALPSGKQWRAHLFVQKHDRREFLALTLGEIDETPTLVRMHTGSVLGDVFDVRSRGRVAIDDVVARIEEEGRGVIVFIPGPIDLESDLAQRLGKQVKPKHMDSGEVLREYGLGAQVLRAIGLRRIRLLTNRPRRIAGVDGYGLEVTEQLVVSEDAALSGEMDAPELKH